jgi:hypothetical protein
LVFRARECLPPPHDRGRRRLEDPEDFVHLEVQAALRRDIQVIPVLVEDAVMPGADELPPGLAGLARRNAHELSDARWSYDTDRLIEAIELRARAAAPAPAPASPPAPARPLARRRRGVAAALAGLAAVVALAVVGVLLLRGGGGDDAAGAEPADEFVVTPGSIVFAEQQVGGASGAAAVEVANAGSEPFSLFAIRLQPEDAYLLDDADCLDRELGPGDPSCELRVRFRPPATGTHEAKLVIREDSSTVARSVALTGAAVEPSGSGGAAPSPAPAPEEPAEMTGTAPIDTSEGLVAPPP